MNETQRTTHTDPPAAADNVRVAIHDTDDLRAHCPEYDSLSRSEKLEVAREVEPVEVVEDHNTTTRGYHEALARHNHPDETGPDFTARYVAFGEDDTAPSIEDDSLVAEGYRVEVTSPILDGRDYVASTFLDATEANGLTLREVGLVTDATGGLFLNRSLLEPSIVKTDENTATVDITLRHRDEGEVS